MSNSISATSQAILTVSIETEFDNPGDKRLLKTVWVFKNENNNPESYIRSIEVWECYDPKNLNLGLYTPKISSLFLFFRSSYCPIMQQGFPEKNFTHLHQGFDKRNITNLHQSDDEDDNDRCDLCRLSVSGSKNIRAFLNIIYRTHQFYDPARAELINIVGKLT